MPVPTLLRADLIDALCDHLPDADSLVLRAMDPADYLTHVETYVSVRRNHPVLPAGLLQDFVNGLVLHLERPRALA